MYSNRYEQAKDGTGCAVIGIGSKELDQHGLQETLCATGFVSLC